MEKNVAFTLEAIHFPIRVLPVPGGPSMKKIYTLRISFYQMVTEKKKSLRRSANTFKN